MTVSSKQLDSGQYSNNSIMLYEQVYGTDFISPGGRDMALELISQMNLKPNSTVLDAGCGLGGSAFVMAAEFGLQVTGVDLSGNMIDRAKHKLEKNGLHNTVSLAQADCSTLEHRQAFDAVYSRDVFLHIENKHRLFTTLHTALRNDGELLFTDYSCGPQPWQPDFSHYVDKRGYFLHTVDEYSALITKAGFRQVEATDSTDRFVQLLKNELNVINTLQLTPLDKQALHDSWTLKLARAEYGDQRWVIVKANK